MKTPENPDSSSPIAAPPPAAAAPRGPVVRWLRAVGGPLGAIRQRRGFALVVILSVLTLLTVLVVAFFLNVTGEVTAAKAFSSGVETKQLADSAINLVQAQIRDATAGFQRDAESGALNPSARLAWASQPGMVRTWDDQGADYRHYKLYSDDEMVITTSHTTSLVEDQDEAVAWAPSDRDGDGFPDSSYDALWVDLNAPVAQTVSGTATLSYPIIVPPSKLMASGTAGVGPPSISVQGDDVVPVDDPATTTQEGVQGFSVTAPEWFDSSAPPKPVNNPVPMPVRWLYVLADGAVVAPASAAASGTAGGVSQIAVAGATKANPVVGRIAFWADDETCKLNLNTAGEGIFWDQPRANTWMERARGFAHHSGGADPSLQCVPGLYGFGWSIPAQNEFHRYPGHPATTSLSAVFGDRMTVPLGFITSDADYRKISDYFALSPRYRDWDGSDKNTAGSMGGRQTMNVDVTDVMRPKNDRLYASVDEFQFAPQLADGDLRRPEHTGFQPEELAQLAFFTTTASRAPDVTLFNTPRLSVWPQMQDGSLRNAKDALLAFCSELRPTTGSGTTAQVQRYYFQRHSPYRGEGNRGSSVQPALDWGISRNQQLYTYVRNLSALPIPGIGGSLESKHTPRVRDQIITEMFDFIRGATNILGNKLEPRYTYAAPLDGTYYPLSGGVQGATTVFAGSPPSGLQGGGGTRGFGRVPILRSVAIVFYCADILQDQDLRAGGAFAGLTDPNFTGYPPDYTLPNGLPDAPDANPYPARSPFGDSRVENVGQEPDDDWLDINGNGIEGEIFDVPNPSRPGEIRFLGERRRIPYATRVGAALVLEPVNLTPGAPLLATNYRFRIRGLGNLRAVARDGNRESFFATDQGTMRVQNSGSRWTGPGFDDLFTTGVDSLRAARTANKNPEDNAYAFIGRINNDGTEGIEVRPGNASGATADRGWFHAPPQFRFEGGTIYVEILDGANNSTAVLQTVEINFPATDVPQPTLRRAVAGYGVDRQDQLRDLRSWDYQIDVDAWQMLYGQSPNNPTPSVGEPPTPPSPQPMRIHPMERDLRYYTLATSGSPATQAGSANAPIQVRIISTGSTFAVADGTMNYTPNPGVNPMVFAERFRRNGTTAMGTNPTTNFIQSGFIRRGDVVRAMELSVSGTAMGDYRLAAAYSSIPATAGYYQPDYQYSDVGVPHAFRMRPTDRHGATMGFAAAPRLARPGAETDYEQSSAGGAQMPCDWTAPPPFLVWPPRVGAGYGFVEDNRAFDKFGWGHRPCKGASFGSPVRYATSPRQAAETVSFANTTGPEMTLPRLWQDKMSFACAPGQNGAEFVLSGTTHPGDWDNAPGWMYDGPWLNLPDQASVYNSDPNYSNRPDRIYFATDTAASTESGLAFSPNRQVASPVMFGSLPRGIDPDAPDLSAPWQTLLFCPNPAAGAIHPGFGSGGQGGDPAGTGPAARPPFRQPPDHLWLDFFNMPVVEPYAISEPFSTGGRINMNYQIQPFNRVERSTGMHAVLKNMMIAAIPTAVGEAAYANQSQSATYKGIPGNGDVIEQLRTGGPILWNVDATQRARNQDALDHHEIRYRIDVAETLEGFAARFAAGDIFRSASEICGIFLVPKPLRFGAPEIPSALESYHPSVRNKAATYENMEQWWGESNLPANPGDGFLCTGDNTREMPYNHVYPRLTTKSNTYRVHFTVQALKQRQRATPATGSGGASSDPYATWDESRDQVLGEYRGSALLERYIDPNDPDLPDFATVDLTNERAVIDKYYKFRVLETKRFLP